MTDPTILRMTAFRSTLSVCLLAGLAVGGCKNRRADKAEPEPTNSGLAVLTNEKGGPTVDTPDDAFEATREQIEASAALLEQAMSDQALADAGEQPGGYQPESSEWQPADAGTPDDGDESPTRFSLLDGGGSGTSDTSGVEATPDVVRIDPATMPPPETTNHAEIEPVETTPVQQVALDPETRKQQLVDELVGVLSGLARTGDAPGSAALALAGLETLRPQALDELKNEGLLSSAEIASLDAARRMFDALQSDGGIADPARVSDVLERIRQDLVASAGMRIARAELCTSVSGYGRFETFGENRFIAGRAQEVIVYAEVDGFGHRETAGPDGDARYEVEMTQRLELYHIADDLNTWNRAAETDRTVSRNRQRDYYLLNQVVLPANLTIGRYHLKVVMRDLVGGTMAEAIIPIEIVAGTRAGALP